MTEHDVIVALAWIMGVFLAALGVILRALAAWVVKHIEALRNSITQEMRAFDVRLNTLETIIGLRNANGDKQHRRLGEADD